MRHAISAGAAALVSLAMVAPAQAQYDGVYTGQVQCGPTGGQRVPAGTVRVNVTGASFTYEVQLAGGGIERGSGSVTAPSLSAGGSASGGGVRYDGSYSGQIMPGNLWMTGAQSGTFPGGARGNRQCSIAARRR
ncbi:MAG: hypothetical protein KF889_09865 [Alphaproteobacteria bacterium]|nr:hypothetical protein [Alphaproteobacteria bacterium]MCW5741127.1 hypothetical protein [Alphaproteobacteria bacterium]